MLRQSLALFFGLISCCGNTVAANSVWKTSNFYHVISFSSINNEGLFTSLRLFDLEHDTAVTSRARQSLREIYGTTNQNYGNLKLAVANLIRHEQELVRITISQATDAGIKKSSVRTEYSNLLDGYGSKDALFDYSAIITHRGKMTHAPADSVELANFGCKLDTKVEKTIKEPTIHTPAINYCTDENLKAQEFLKHVVSHSIISAGVIKIKSKESSDEFYIYAVISLDTSDVSCKDNPTCSSYKYSLIDAFKSFNYRLDIDHPDQLIETSIFLENDSFEYTQIQNNLAELP